MKKLFLLFSILLTSNNVFAVHKYIRIVDDQYMGKICYNIPSTTPQNYKDALNHAIHNYNITFNSTTKINLCYSSGTYIYGATYVVDVIVDDYGIGRFEHIMGYSDFPSWYYNKPGDFIKINTAEVENAGLYYEQIVALFMHEIGHTLGIMHTNQDAGKIIFQTNQDSEPENSLFYPAEAGGNIDIFWFSYYDEVALKWMYQN